MSRKEEFFKAVEVIKKALLDGVVTSDISSDPTQGKPLEQVVINTWQGVKATYPQDCEGADFQHFGVQTNFVVGVLEQSEKTRRDIEVANKLYEETVCRAIKAKQELDEFNSRADELMAQIVLLRGTT